jgi:hypothetical protein
MKKILFRQRRGFVGIRECTRHASSYLSKRAALLELAPGDPVAEAS